MAIVEEELPSRLGGLGALVTGAAGTAAAWHFMFNVRSFPYVGAPDSTVRLYPEQALACAKPWEYLTCRSAVVDHTTMTGQAFSSYYLMMALPLILGVLWLGYTIWKHSFDQHRRRYVSGSPVQPVSAALRALKRERSGWFTKKDGIEILPGMKLSRKREKRGFLGEGAPGSGKSLVAERLIVGAQKRGDRLIVVDVSGDMTEVVGLDHSEEGQPIDPILLAPHDRRSAMWDVARDTITAEDAKELADLLVAELPGDKAFFVNSARMILKVCILALMDEKKGDWTWEDLGHSVARPIEELREEVAKHDPKAQHLLTEGAEEQTGGTLGTLMLAMSHVNVLAKAWSNSRLEEGKLERFSLQHFMYRQRTGRSVIVQRSGRFPNLSDAWISAFLSLAGRLVGTPEMPSNDKSPLWFIVDEFGDLPRIPNVERIISQGRKKGVRNYLGVQDPSQIEAKYEGTMRKLLQSMIGTSFIGRYGASDTAKHRAEAFGHAKSVRREYGDGTPGNRGKLLPETFPVLSPQDIQDLGEKPNLKGCEMYLVNVASGPVKVVVPYSYLEKVRAPVEPAHWTTIPYHIAQASLRDQAEDTPTASAMPSGADVKNPSPNKGASSSRFEIADVALDDLLPRKKKAMSVA